MVIEQLIEKYRTEVLENDSDAHKALDRMVSLVFSQMLLNSKMAVRIPHDYDESSGNTHIAVKFNNDKSITLLSGQILKCSETNIKTINMIEAKIYDNETEAKEYEGWISTEKAMPPEREWVLCVSMWDDKSIPVIAAVQEHALTKQKRFVMNYKINGVWSHYEIDNITHWQPIPFAPKNNSVVTEIKPEFNLNHRMPFTQQRKSKKKKKRRR